MGVLQAHTRPNGTGVGHARNRPAKQRTVLPPTGLSQGPIGPSVDTRVGRTAGPKFLDLLLRTSRNRETQGKPSKRPGLPAKMAKRKANIAPQRARST